MPSAQHDDNGNTRKAHKTERTHDVTETKKEGPIPRLQAAAREFFEVNKDVLDVVAASRQGELKTMMFRGVHGLYPSPRTKGWCAVTTLITPEGVEIPQWHVVMSLTAPVGGLDKCFPERWGNFPKYWCAIGWEEKPFIAQTGVTMCSNFSAHALLMPDAATDDDFCPVFTAGSALGAVLAYSIPAWVIEICAVEPFTAGFDGEELKGRVIKFKYNGADYDVTQYRMKNYDIKDPAALQAGMEVLMLGIKVQASGKLVNGSCCQLIPKGRFVEMAGLKLWNILAAGPKTAAIVTKKTASTF